MREKVKKPNEYRLIELFAGTAMVSRMARVSGINVEEPVEKYEDPIEQQGYIEKMDLSRHDTQKRILGVAEDEDGPNLWVIAPPCASFSNLHQINKTGPRTKEFPEGIPGKANDKEEQANELLSFIEKLVGILNKRKKAYIIENPGYTLRKDANYPNIWETKWMKNILANHETELIECDMCAFNKKPTDGDENEFFKKPTILLTPKCKEARERLGKKCTLTGNQHCHVKANGKSGKTGKDRSKEAGGYTKELAEAIIHSLIAIYNNRKAEQADSNGTNGPDEEKKREKHGEHEGKEEGNKGGHEGRRTEKDKRQGGREGQGEERQRKREQEEKANAVTEENREEEQMEDRENEKRRQRKRERRKRDEDENENKTVYLVKTGVAGKVDVVERINEDLLVVAQDLEVPPKGRMTIKLNDAMLLPRRINARIELSLQGQRAKWLKLDENIIEEKMRSNHEMVLYNHGEQEIKLNKQEVLARIEYEEILTPEIHEVKELEITARGENGFGSTGERGDGSVAYEKEDKQETDEEGKRNYQRDDEDENALKIVVGPKAKKVEYKGIGSTAIEITSKETIMVKQGELTIVNSGIRARAPMGTYLRLMTANGLGKKRGITVGAGIIDRGYIGEIKVVLFNHGSTDYLIKKGWKIAKMYVQKKAYGQSTKGGIEKDNEEAGIDLRSTMDHSLDPGESVWIPIKDLPKTTPEGAIVIAPRSGQTVKKRLDIGSKWVEDAENVKIKVTNHSDKSQKVFEDERIAQAVIHKRSEVQKERLHKVISVKHQRKLREPGITVERKKKGQRCRRREKK